MKICTKCNQEKLLIDFKKQSSTKDGHSYICKECSKIIAQEYYRKNQEKLIKQSLDWAKKNSEKYKEYQKNYERK